MEFSRSHEAVKDVLDCMGEDIEREGLVDTPDRVVRSWQELYRGYEEDPEEILSRDFNSEGYDEMVVLRNVEMFSMCEHHMLPFFGRAHVAYIPRERVVGLSKLARVVDCFARRLQIQEHLTMQIAQAIMEYVNPKGVGVVIEAEHLCMRMRGVSKQNATMTTSTLLGDFKEAPVRSEFFTLVGGFK